MRKYAHVTAEARRRRGRRIGRAQHLVVDLKQYAEDCADRASLTKTRGLVAFTLNGNANAGAVGPPCTGTKVPVTSASSERLFWIVGTIKSKRRARASADTLQMRTFLRANRVWVDLVNGLESEGSTRLEVYGEDLISTSEALHCSLQIASVVCAGPWPQSWRCCPQSWRWQGPAILSRR